ncbi:Clr5 domain-containing protein [Apiospora arundinis]|uniref:Clr5 domain-containing protein n=1 Tax=Apiospora arundinis TaxID=335852 RepID=A0ABR2JII7_9PEZI
MLPSGSKTKPPSMSPKAWASAQEWESRRETITRLFWDENRPLREVVEIMSRDHGFNATPKMYKARTREWGLKKNLKVSETREIIRQAKHGEITVPLEIRGRKIGSKMLKENLRVAKSSSVSDDGSDDWSVVRSVSPSPIATNIASPNMHRMAEAALRAISDYSTLAFQSSTFTFSSDNMTPYNWGSQPSTWLQRLWVAADNVAQDRDSAANFQNLNYCFDMCVSLLRQESPESLAVAHVAFFKLLGVGPDLAKVFSRFLLGLSTIKNGKSHPLTRFWLKYNEMGPEEARRAASTIMRAYFDRAAAHLKQSNWTVMYLQCNHSRLLHKQGAFPLSEVEAIFETTLTKMRNDMLHASSPAEMESLAPDFRAVQMQLVFFLSDNGRFFEADQLLQEIGLWWQSDPQNAQKYAVLYSVWVMAKGKIFHGLQRYTEAQPYFLEYYGIVKTTAGPSHSTTTSALYWLKENTLKLKSTSATNDTELLVKVEEEYNDSWDMARIIKQEEMEERPQG